MEFTSLTRRVAEATETDASARSMRPKWPWTPRLRCAGPTSIRAGEGRRVIVIWQPAKGDDTAGLAKRRATEATASAKIDTSAYETSRYRRAQGLVRHGARGGLVAFDTETTSLDAMQAELVGFSLCASGNAPTPAI
jgi:DNA polymerase-1